MAYTSYLTSCQTSKGYNKLLFLLTSYAALDHYPEGAALCTPKFTCAGSTAHQFKETGSLISKGMCVPSVSLIDAP